jgi:hypothetical protein
MQFRSEFLISVERRLPGHVDRDMGDGGQAFQSLVQLMFDVVGPVNGTCSFYKPLN